MADKKIYRRCGNCGAVLKPGDSFCPQCGIGTEQSYVAREPASGQMEQQYETQRYQQERPGNRNRHRQGEPEDRNRHRQGEPEDRNRHRQGEPEDRNRHRQGDLEDRNRYRQENLKGDWSEDWGRPVDENRITAMQCVLIVLLVILLIALLALGGFWMFGRSGNKTAGQRGEQQDAVTQTELESERVTGDIVTILDPNTGKPVTEEKQSETAASQPEDTVQQSETAASQPEDTVQQSETAASQPEDTVQQSETPDAQAETPAQQPDGSSDTAAAWSQPESSSRLLTDSDLEGLDYDGLQMAINEIYARHGRIFKTPEIGSYFESQPWYEGTLDADHFDESVFTAVEAQNIQFILKKMGDG